MVHCQYRAKLMNKLTLGKEKKTKLAWRREKIREVQCALQAVRQDWTTTLISLFQFMWSGGVWLQVKSLFNYKCRGQEKSGIKR